jgi:nitric oxide synthase oxygenase domain/subunit
MAQTSYSLANVEKNKAIDDKLSWKCFPLSPATTKIQKLLWKSAHK